MAKIKGIKMGVERSSPPKKRSPIPKSVGERLRFARGNLSRVEFAELLGAHVNTVRNWETGSSIPKSEIIVRLLEILNVNLNWLFSGKGKPYLDDQASVIYPDAIDDQPISRIIVVRRGGGGSKKAGG